MSCKGAVGKRHHITRQRQASRPGDVLLPSALVFLLLLYNDGSILGPSVNPRWLNVLAGAVVAGFLVLSGSSLFPRCSPACDRLACHLVSRRRRHERGHGR